MGADYATKFTIFNDRKSHFPRFSSTTSSTPQEPYHLRNTAAITPWSSSRRIRLGYPSIVFINYISTAFTLQQLVKEQVVNALMNLERNKEEISALSTISKDDIITTNISSKKRSTDGEPKVPEEDNNKHITFPAFNLSTKMLTSAIHPIASLWSQRSTQSPSNTIISIG